MDVDTELPGTLDIVPDLFGMLCDLETGVLLARDFEKHAGSIRLRIASFKEQLARVPGIDESSAFRLQRILQLEESNSQKREMLAALGEQMRRDFGSDH